MTKPTPNQPPNEPLEGTVTQPAVEQEPQPTPDAFWATPAPSQQGDEGTPRRSVQSPKKKKRWVWVLVAIGAALALLVAGYVAGSPSSLLPVATNASEPPVGEGEGSEAPAPSGDPSDVKGAKERATYNDGLQIWITDVQRGRVGRDDGMGSVHPGDTTIRFTVHVKNGTSHQLSADEYMIAASYGKDGNAGEQVYSDWEEELGGVITKGRVKSGRYEFTVPAKYLGNVLVEVTDWEHDAAVFQAAVK